MVCAQVFEQPVGDTTIGKGQFSKNLRPFAKILLRVALGELDPPEGAFLENDSGDGGHDAEVDAGNEYVAEPLAPDTGEGTSGSTSGAGASSSGDPGSVQPTLPRKPSQKSKKTVRPRMSSLQAATAGVKHKDPSSSYLFYCFCLPSSMLLVVGVICSLTVF